MKTRIILFSLLIFSSCTNLSVDKMSQWKGRGEKELINHPYWSGLRHKEFNQDNIKIIHYYTEHIVTTCDNIYQKRNNLFPTICTSSKELCTMTFNIENNIIISFKNNSVCELNQDMMP